MKSGADILTWGLWFAAGVGAGMIAYVQIVEPDRLESAYSSGAQIDRASHQATHEGTTAITHDTLTDICGVKDISEVLIRDDGIYCRNGKDFIKIQPEFTFKYTGGTDDK